MTNAVAMAPEDRFVLRSATRLWVHRDQADRALRLLRSSQRLIYDPWMIAAEIATANLMGVPSKSLKRGFDLVGSRRFSAFHISELASAIATLELESGARRKARKLFQLALSEPTENAVAQAQWAGSIDSSVKVDPASLEISAEAGAWQAFRAAQWDLALSEVARWQRDQFFSKQPAIFGSFIAMFCMRDSSKAEQIINIGLVANPRDEVLLNNRAVVLSELGEIDRAEKILTALPALSSFPNWDAIREATAGLVQFRKGNVEAGSAMYGHAVELLRSSRPSQQLAVALAYWAREEIRARTPISEAILQEATAANKDLGAPHIEEWLQHLRVVIGAQKRDSAAG